MARPYNREQMIQAISRAYPNQHIRTSEELIQAISRAYPNQHIRTSEEFGDSYQGGIWLSAEDGTVDRSGIEIFDYYSESSLYEFGVVKHLNAYVERHGWYFEWNDAGTIMMWLN